MWTEDKVEHRGEHFTIAGLGASIKPKQPSGPPIWIGGDVVSAVKRAAKLGCPWIIPPTMALNDIAIRINAYDQTIKTLGNEKVKGQPLIRELAIGRTKQEAFEVARKPLLAKYESYATWGQTDTKKERTHSDTFECAHFRFEVLRCGCIVSNSCVLVAHSTSLIFHISTSMGNIDMLKQRIWNLFGQKKCNLLKHRT